MGLDRLEKHKNSKSISVAVLWSQKLVVKQKWKDSSIVYFKARHILSVTAFDDDERFNFYNASSNLIAEDLHVSTLANVTHG